MNPRTPMLTRHVAVAAAHIRGKLSMITRRLTSPLLALATIAGVAAVGCAKSGGAPHPEIAAETRANPSPVTVVPNPALTRVGAESIADITERVLPSVVNISMTKVTKMSAP